MGRIIPYSILWKIQNVPNHQPDMINAWCQGSLNRATHPMTSGRACQADGSAIPLDVCIVCQSGLIQHVSPQTPNGWKLLKQPIFHIFHMISPYFHIFHMTMDWARKSHKNIRRVYPTRPRNFGLINFGQAQYSIVIDILGCLDKWSREPP